MPEAKKVCSRCKEAKPLSGFYALQSASDGYMPYCKKCDNARPRKPTGTKINRMRARHRAVADLISFHEEEFEALLAIRLAEATEEAAALEETPAAKKHYGGKEPPRLRPGPRMAGETAGDRIDVARCPHCIRHHDAGHVCANCGSIPGLKTKNSTTINASGARTGVDPAALAEFNSGVERARRGVRR